MEGIGAQHLQPLHGVLHVYLGLVRGVLRDLQILGRGSAFFVQQFGAVQLRARQRFVGGGFAIVRKRAGDFRTLHAHQELSLSNFVSEACPDFHHAARRQRNHRHGARHIRAHHARHVQLSGGSARRCRRHRKQIRMVHLHQVGVGFMLHLAAGGASAFTSGCLPLAPQPARASAARISAHSVKTLRKLWGVFKSSAIYDFRFIQHPSDAYLLAKVALSFDRACWPRLKLFIESEWGIAAVNFGQTHGSKSVVLARAGFLIGVVALIDWRVDLNISFGFLYLFPILLVATAFSRWQIVATAFLCTLLSDVFDPFAFTLAVAMPQDILVFTSLAGTGLFAYEITQSRRKEMENLRKVEREAAARREAEEQLEFLIDSSPAAILTMGADCSILRANSAAHRLFGVAHGQLPGKNIRPYIPALGRVPFLGQPFLGETPQTFRTEMQCRGEREHGDVFLANVFFSTYQTAMGPRLAALIVDASEELREREEASLEQLMAGSRILMGAVSHEVRNVCGAIAVLYENLVRSGRLQGNKDFEIG